MALIGPSSIPPRVFVDENGVWWRSFDGFDSLIPTTMLPMGLPESGVPVAEFTRVRPIRQTNIVEGDPAVDELSVAVPPDEVKLEELSVGYESRWHQHHAAYVDQCADCRRERARGMR